MNNNNNNNNIINNNNISNNNNNDNDDDVENHLHKLRLAYSATSNLNFRRNSQKHS